MVRHRIRSVSEFASNRQPFGYPLTSVVLVILAASVFLGGCQLLNHDAKGPASNPLLVRGVTPEQMWEPMIAVLHRYHFEIARENRLDGVIETEYRVGSGCFEPWHHDSVGAYERTESTFQSIRRKVIVSLMPSEGGTLISIQAIEELEDPPGVGVGTPGSATFEEVEPLQRNLDLALEPLPPTGWIPQGRVPELEGAIARSVIEEVSPSSR